MTISFFLSIGAIENFILQWYYMKLRKKNIILPDIIVGLEELREIWEARDLLLILIWRNIKIKYSSPWKGIFLAIVKPLLFTIVLSIFFGSTFGKSTKEIANVPYPIFAGIGVLLWSFFLSCLNDSSGELARQQKIIKNVYFPRLLIPLSAIGVCILTFILSTISFCILLAYYRFTPHLLGIELFIPISFIILLTGFGTSLIISSVNVLWKESRGAVPFMKQGLIFITPVIYPSSILGSHSWIWFINPLAGSINVQRAALLGIEAFQPYFLLSAFLLSCSIFALGLAVFMKIERYLAELI